MEAVKAIILGIIQGITEWLPVSSTGHMILANEFMQLLRGQNKDFVDLFLVVIQFSSILAVVTLYFNKLNPFSPKKTAVEKGETWTMWWKVLVATIPAAIVGLLFDDMIDEKMYNWYTVAAMLALYGAAFIIIEKRKKEPTILSIEGITYKTALLMGVFQMLALVPGTSRSGATILGA
ncbi:MAG: undecaprenyl-diphosphate phosphatase, partial [Clostridia bacterium]|nr:undecaprenyl-diphosphate phosphatase [Clostridia bacterium]